MSGWTHRGLVGEPGPEGVGRGCGPGPTGPRGPYTAWNEEDLVRHTLHELEDALEGERRHDSDGNAYVTADYYVICQAAEALGNYQKLLAEPEGQLAAEIVRYLSGVAKRAQGGGQVQFRREAAEGGDDPPELGRGQKQRV